MPQSLAKVYIHTVFSTKNRKPFLADVELRCAAHSYIGGVVKKLNCNPVCVGGVEDHVHLLTTLSRTVNMSDFVKEIKRASAIWIQEHPGASKEFHWQSGYGTFSISQSHVDQTVAYIENQATHHRRFDFQTEFRKLLRLYHVEFDERYVWD